MRRRPEDARAGARSGGGGREIYPCLDFPTLGDELDRGGRELEDVRAGARAYDGGFQGSAGYIWTVYDAIRHMRDSAEWAEHIVPTEQFAIDAKNGNLPAA